MPAKARPAEGGIAKIPDHKPAEVLPLDQRLSGWWQTLVVATRATMVAPGISLTVVLGLTSLFLAGAPLLLRDAPWLLVPGALILAIALSVPATYRLVQPEQFAAAAVEGKGAKFVVAYVSSRIDRVCRRFYAGTERSRELLRNMHGLGEKAALDPRHAAEGRDEIREYVRQLERLAETSRRDFQRLDGLKRAAARELGVHHRRLCDHLFQFSPLMFEKGAWRYLAIWRLIENATTVPLLGRPGSHLDSLVQEVLAIEDNCRRRIDEQVRLRGFSDLHPDIVRFAANLSTSDSLVEYALTLAGLTRPRRHFWSRRARPPSLLDLEQALEFVFRKQRAHPGYDLHSLLTQLCRQATPRHSPGDRRRRVGLQVEVLERLGSPLPREGGWLAGCGSGKTNELIEALATLPLTILRHESGVGAEIAKRFVTFCRAWSGTERDGMTFIVTTGYSRTVAESVATAVESHPSFRAFLLTDHEPEQMSARLMKVQVTLRHARNASSMKRYAGGPASMLLGLLKRGDRLVLLLGAECCDGDGRVAHPRLLEQDVSRVVASARGMGAHVDVVVVAAHYKMVAGRLAASRFYADHFDGVTVLGEPLVTTLITEKRSGVAAPARVASVLP